MAHRFGDIVVVPFPFTDQSATSAGAIADTFLSVDMVLPGAAARSRLVPCCRAVAHSSHLSRRPSRSATPTTSKIIRKGTPMKVLLREKDILFVK